MGEVTCDICGKPIQGVPFRCRYCGGTFCAEHHLPPNHNCPGLAQWASRLPPGTTMRYERRTYSAVRVPEGYEHRVEPQPATAPAGRSLEVPARVRRGTGSEWQRSALLLVVFSALFVLVLAAALVAPNPLLGIILLALFAAMMRVGERLQPSAAVAVAGVSMLAAALTLFGFLTGNSLSILLSIVLFSIAVLSVMLKE